MEKRDWTNVFLIAIAGLLLIFTGVFLFTRYSRPFTLDLSNKGSLGDAVNGLSAPIISFFSALLIYITFREQNKANKIQVEANRILQNQWRFDTYLKLFEQIQNSIEKVSVTVSFTEMHDDGFEYLGSEALIQIAVQSDSDLIGKTFAKERLDAAFSEWIYLIDNMAENKFFDKLVTFKIFTYYNGTIQNASNTYINKLNSSAQTGEDLSLLVTLNRLTKKIEKLKALVVGQMITEKKNEEGIVR